MPISPRSSLVPMARPSQAGHPAAGLPKKISPALPEDSFSRRAQTLLPAAPVAFIPCRPGIKIQDEDARRQERILDQWCIAVATLHDGDTAPQSLRVRDILADLRTALLKRPSWTSMDVWLGGSAAVWRMGVPWHRQSPQDLDPIFYIRRASDQQMDILQTDVLSSLAYIQKPSPKTDHPHATRHIRSHIQLSVDGHDAMLVVTLGTGDEHIDLRFVFADARFAPYDFRCNALLCDAFDSASWSVLPGAPVDAVMRDVDLGVYTMDHALRHTGVIRAAKMRALGLVPNTPNQDGALWDALWRSVHTGGAQDTQGPALRLNTVFHNEVRRAYTSEAAARKICCLLVNALASLSTQQPTADTAMARQQLGMTLSRLVHLCPPSPALAAWASVACRDGGLSAARLWLTALAGCSDSALSSSDENARWPISRPRHTPSEHVRCFDGALNGFVVLHAAEPSNTESLGSLPVAHTPPAPLHTAGGVAWLLGAAELFDTVSEALWQDPDRMRQIAQQLANMACAHADADASMGLRLGLAAIALYPRATIPDGVRASLLQLGPSPLTCEVFKRWHLNAALGVIERLETLEPAGEDAEHADVNVCANDWRTLGSAAVYFGDVVDITACDALSEDDGLGDRLWPHLVHRSILGAARLPALCSHAQQAICAVLKSVALPRPNTAPKLMAALVHLRAQDTHNNFIAPLKRALRSPLKALQQHPELNQATATILFSARQDAPSQRFWQMAQVIALVPFWARYIHANDAYRIVDGLHISNSWHTRHAVGVCLDVLARHGRLAGRLCVDTERVAHLLQHRDMRPGVLRVLMVAKPDSEALLRLVVAHYIADGQAPSLTNEVLRELWPKAVLQVVLQHIQEASTGAALLLIWQRIMQLSSAAAGRLALDAGQVFEALCERLASAPEFTQNQRPKAISAGHIRGWLEKISFPQDASDQARIGLAHLWLCVSHPRACLETITPVCARAIPNDSALVQMWDLAQQAAEQLAVNPQPRSLPALKAAAQAVLHTQYLGRGHIPHTIATIRALAFSLSQHGAHKLAGDVVLHAFCVWHQRHITWAFGGYAIWGVPDGMDWAETILRSLEQPDKALVFVPIADRIIVRTLDAWVTACDVGVEDMPSQASLHIAFAQVWALIAGRSRRLSLRAHDGVFVSLVKAMHHPKLAHQAQLYLGALQPASDADDFSTHMGMYRAWLDAALTPNEHATRRTCSLAHLGLDANLCLTQQMPQDADGHTKLCDALAQILPGLCGAQVDAPMRLKIWNNIVGCFLQRRPKLVWLDAALLCHIDAPERIAKRLEVHMNMRLRALERAAPGAHAPVEFAMVFMHYAMSVSPITHDLKPQVRLVEQVMHVMQERLHHPNWRWQHTVSAFYDKAPPHLRAEMKTFARLQAYFRDSDAAAHATPHQDAMQYFSEECLLHVLNAESYDQLLHSLHHLRQTSCDRLKSWQPSDPWRLALMLGFRQLAWTQNTLKKYAVCDPLEAHPNMGYMLATVIDGLWDTGHLGQGPLMGIVHVIVRLWLNPKLRPGVEAAMDKLTLYAQSNRVVDALGAAVAARDTQAKHNLNARGRAMIQRFIDALALTDAAALLVTVPI